MSKVVFISPHPDDETLGCGGTILKHKSQNDKIYWINFTSIKNSDKKYSNKIKQREREINKVIKFYKFNYFKSLNFDTTTLDSIPLSILVNELKKEFDKINPEIVYVPFLNDNHTDHKVVNEVVTSCFKWFRSKNLKKLLAYETLSETNFNYSYPVFSPNEFHNITKFIKKKIQAMKIYKSEIGKHPFPRSETAIKSKALLRGTESGFKYAEAFMCLYNALD